MLLVISFLVTPILSLQSSQNISSYGVVSYSSGKGWLRTEGKWIVDSEGNIVILRGANFMGYEFGAWDSHTEEDYARMASWGFNVVRLPIAWHYIEPQPGAYNSSYFEIYVDRDIAWAKKYGIYIILDMHQWYWSPHFSHPHRGNGMPVWLVGEYPDSEEGRRKAITDFWLGKGPNGTVASQTNPSMQDRYVEAWKYVASRYSNEPFIMGYDLFNEPQDPKTEDMTSQQVADSLFSLYDKLIETIRAIDSSHIIIYQTLGGGAWWARLIDNPNIAFSCHYYDLDETYNGNVTEIENDFLNRRWNLPQINPIKNWGIPILVGEFGYDVNWENCELWVRDVLFILEKYPIKGHLWWSYYKHDTFGNVLLYENGSERLQVKYLDRPYPATMTFQPQKWFFDFETKEFLLAAPPGANTVQIYLPKRHYSTFEVFLDSDNWQKVWNDNNRILTIHFTSEKLVHITIVPS